MSTQGYRTFRDVDDLLAERGIMVSDEAIRQSCRLFGPEYIRCLKRKGRLVARSRDKLKSYGGASRNILPAAIHDTQPYANNRAERSHQSFEVWRKATAASNGFQFSYPIPNSP